MDQSSYSRKVMDFIKHLLSLMAILSFFVSLVESGSLIKAFVPEDVSEIVGVANNVMQIEEPNLFVSDVQSESLIRRISKGFEPEDDREVVEIPDNGMTIEDPNLFESYVPSSSLISRTSKGFEPDTDSKFVEILDNKTVTQEHNLFVSDVPSESHISRKSKNDSEVVELVDNELQTQNPNLFVNYAQSGSLISRISKGFEPQDDSEAVEIPDNEVQAKDLNLFDLSSFGRALYGIPDFNYTARLVDAYIPEESPVNPEELGSYVEGDILIPQSSIILKNGLVSSSTRWPNGVVPYEIGGQFRRDDLGMIANAIDQYHDRTCIRFVPRTDERDYITIVDGKSGCWSSIGRVGGRQEVNLQSPGCLTKPGTAIHELMHVLGFLHEQNRQERDSFVTIKYENIREVAYGNFKKVSPTIAFGVPYDYGSVMHYSSRAFSQNGQPTIVARAHEGKKVMGQRDGFSPLDVEKINRMYNCYENAKPAPPPVQLTNPPAPTMPSIFRAARPIANFFRNIIRG